MLPKLIHGVDEARAWSREQRTARRRPVLVPTMGDLHEGHLSLVRTGAEFGPVMVSIFVNPTQFGPGEDFDRYPRDLERDLAALEGCGAEVVFAPGVRDMYPRGTNTQVMVAEPTGLLCGAHRPGHFTGVTTVVASLFHICEPEVAVFGEKDAQQCLVLQRMVEDLHMPIRLLFSPLIREADGLALSSRNRYLDARARVAALALSRGLDFAVNLIAKGERDLSAVESAWRAQMSELRLDYAEIRSLPDLSHPLRAEGRLLLAIAAHVGGARLIDNRCIMVDAEGCHPAALHAGCTPAALREFYGSFLEGES